jgi:iron complex transport system substrate-binding protein
MRRRAVLILAVAMGLGGCGGPTSPSAGPSPSADVRYTAGGLTLDKRPEKIVSLSPTATETLFAIGAGSQVTAVDDQSNYPPEAPRTDLSGFKPNAEAIAAKQPDLVVIANDIDKIKAQLTTLKIPVYLAAAATSLPEAYQQFTDLGALTGHRAEAEALAGKTKDEIGKLVAGVPSHPRTKYYYELDPTLYTVTSKTFVGSLFSMFGLNNIADPADADGAKGGYPQLGPEALVNANPDMVFLADTRCCKQSLATVKARPGWANVAAVRAGRVIGLDDDVASRWGPRIVDLVRAIADALHNVPA